MNFIFRPFILMIIGLAIMAGVFFYLSRTKPFLGWFNKPAAYVYDKIFFASNIYGKFSNWSQLAEKFKRLEEENLTLLSRLGDYDRLNSENESLRHALGVQAFKQSDIIFAGVSGVNFNPNGHDLILNKGYDEGVNQGDIVVATAGFLVGIVGEVRENYSKVSLITSPSVSITVKNIDSNTSGIAKGSMENGMELEFVSQKDPLAEGDLVVSTGSDQYPEGLIVGKVSSIKIPAGSLFKEIFIKPFIQEARFDKVMVLK